MDYYWREKIRRLVQKLSSKEKPPYYDVDHETRELLEAALNMVAQTATLQIHEDSALGLLDICDSIAERFGIESHEISVKDETPDYEGGDSSITVYRTQRPANSNGTGKPKFKVIDGDKLNRTTPDDDDPIH
jgi:hypothetical protein